MVDSQLAQMAPELVVVSFTADGVLVEDPFPRKFENVGVQLAGRAVN